MKTSPTSIDDATIIRAVLSGDREKFAHLVIRYKDLVFGMIMRQVADQTIAEDLAQETFVKAFKNLASFRGESTFPTWVTKIALNVSHSYFTSRAYRNRCKSDSFDLAKHGNLASTESENEKYRDEQRIETIRRAVGSLKREFREVIVLYSFEERSYEEISALLDIPIGTVRSRLNKARLLIKNAVSQDLEI